MRNQRHRVPRSFTCEQARAALVARAHEGRLILEQPRPGMTGFSVSLVLWDNLAPDHREDAA